MGVNTSDRTPFLWVGVARDEAEPAAYWSALQADGASLRDVDALFDQPSLHFVAFDRARDAGLFVRLDEAAYRSASFLDHGRLASFVRDANCMIGVPREGLLERALPAPQTTHFIFHTAHCGSTLLSRALAAVTNSLPLREPPVLRWAAQSLRSAPHAEETARCIALSAALVGRRFDASAPAVVKATSWTSNLGAQLLSRDASARALCLFQPLDEHVVALAPYATSDVQAAARTAQQDLGLSMEANALSDQIALGWLGRIWSMHQLELAYPGQVTFLSQQTLLATPEQSVRRVADHFALTLQSQPTLRVPTVWDRSAKAPGEPFDPAAHANQRAHARISLTKEIAAAQRRVEELCSSTPQLKAAVERVQATP